MTAAGDAAVFARLRSDARLANIVFEGTVTGGPDVYVSVFAPLGRDSADRFTGPSGVNETTYTIHCVARDIAGAKSTARRVAALLTDWTPAVPGARRITHPVSRPPQYDRDSTPALWFVVDQYDLTVG